MKIGIIKERKTPPDRRVVFSPEKLEELRQTYPDITIKVEPSDIRIFPDEAYKEKGFRITDDLSDCDLLIGVKEVPVEALIPRKKYFFFSHTLKKQPYNRELLQAILQKNISLYDHETVTTESGSRLIGFGRYAGIVGAYNGFRALGKRKRSFELPKVEQLPDYQAVIEALQHVKLPQNHKIVLTGQGKVAGGAREILQHLQLREVSANDFLEKDFQEPVFTQIQVLDYNKRKDGQVLGEQDFFDHPEAYEADFMRFARIADYFIAGHFYGDGSPYLFTREDAKQDDFNISLVADVSCDIDGPVASTIRPSTIADPFYGYHPKSEREIAFDDPEAITVMAVDNLPCELPKDASEGFGEMFLEHVMPAFFNNDKDQILERAKMTENGKLTPRFSYLRDFVEGKE